MRAARALLSGLRSDSHTWSLAYLHLWLEERKIHVHNLGGCVELDVLLATALRERPPLVVLSTVNGLAELEALDVIAAFRQRGLLDHMHVVIGGKLAITPEREAALRAGCIEAGYSGVFVGPDAMSEFEAFLKSVSLRGGETYDPHAADGASPADGISGGAFAIRRLTHLHEFQAAIDLQRTIWGFPDIDLFPVRVFVTMSKIGGQTLGAFGDDDTLLGFCLAYPGLRSQGRSYLHSQILGIHPDYQNRGIGRALKLAQRQDALCRHVDLVQWVFDPLDVRLAHFNLEGLGCIVRTYERNRYGPSSSPAHAGLPTDRCVVEWRLNSPRVLDAIQYRATRPGAGVAIVQVPNDFAALKRQDPRKAMRAQGAVADQLEAGFRQGLAVIGFERGETAGAYVLGVDDEAPPARPAAD